MYNGKTHRSGIPRKPRLTGGELNAICNTRKVFGKILLHWKYHGSARALLICPVLSNHWQTVRDTNAPNWVLKSEVQGRG